MTELNVETQPSLWKKVARISARSFMILVSVLLVLLLAASGWFIWTIHKSFPIAQGTLTVNGLDSSVEVHRDSFGVPTIVAETSHDLFFSQGFVHAQDRFWEMDFRRHMTAGRLSELFGESQVGTDSFLRTLGWRKIAEQEVANMDEETLAYFQAYADGVNAYLEDRDQSYISLEYVILSLTTSGYEIEPWTPADSVAWLKAMAWDLRSNMDDEIERALVSFTVPEEEAKDLFPEYDYENNPVILPESATVPKDVKSVEQSVATSYQNISNFSELLQAAAGNFGDHDPSIGSNSWVIGGEYTATGMPLLANDPHLGATMPSIWHQSTLLCKTLSEECPFQVSGFGFSGFPGVVIGHNNVMAWGFTNLGPDVADLYLEKIEGDNYVQDGKELPLEIRQETIRVAGGEDVELTIRETHHGPIISDVYPDAEHMAENGQGLPVQEAKEEAPDGEYAISLRWTALQEGTTPYAIFLMNAAQNFEDFRYAAAKFNVPAQNLVYADTDGNFGYQAPGLIPVRGTGDGASIAPGWDSRYDWQGYIPFEDLPYSYNPPEGYIVTANNAAVTKDWPYLIKNSEDWDYGYRADRIENMIEDKLTRGKLTALDMVQIQSDNYNWIAEQLVPELLKGLPVNQETARAINLLKDWDFHDDADSAASAYFNVFWKNLLHEMFTEKYPELSPAGNSKWFTVVANLIDDPDSMWWTNAANEVSGMTQMLTRTAELATEELTELQGSNVKEWSWGDLHAITVTSETFGSSGIAPIEWLFNRGPYATGGGSSIVNATGWKANSSYATSTVPSLRMVVDLNDFNNSTWNHLTGNSGHAFHPNYIDQMENWQQVKQQEWFFDLNKIEEITEDTLILEPQK